MGVDTSANASGAFTGDGREVVFRNNHRFVIPNSANNGYLTPISLNEGAATEGVPRFAQGVLFGSDTANANILDDYEEGTWTPQMYDANGQNVVLSVTSGSCFYTKVGRIVNASAIITRNETGSRTGMLTVSHLPYTSYTAHSQLCAGTWWMDRGFGNDTVGGVCYIPGNGTRIHFVNPTAVHTNAGGDDAAKSATRYLEYSQWANNKHIYFNVTYMTS